MHKTKMIERLQVKAFEGVYFNFNIIEDRIIESKFFPEKIFEDYSSNFAETVRKMVEKYFSGKNVNLSEIQTVQQTTNFTKRVFEILKTVEYGKRITYSEIAKKLGNTRFARAVGGCMARNKTPLFIPCHRVVSNRGIGGFSATGGVWLKQKLLELEKKN